jgi:hypothetical protein
MAENDMEAGLPAMTGVDVEVETVGEVGVSIWLSPGITVDSFSTPRPLEEFTPLLDELGAASPDSADGLDDVDDGVFETAPTTESDVVVVVVAVFVGAAVLVAVKLSEVESFFRIAARSATAVGALIAVESVREDLVPSACTVASGDDFLISL